MAGRDDGEFELILGNKQLLSVLFIVIVLLGVFFAMGFLAGRSTGPGATEVAKRDAEQIPITVDAATTKASEAVPPSPVAQPEAAPVETKPADAAAVKQEPPKQEAPKQEAPKQEPAKTAAVKPAEAAKATAPEPPKPVQSVVAGTYLQVAAVNRTDAQNMLGYIGEKAKLHGAIAPVPKSSELFRVLVGPLKSNEELAAARTKLADIGIKTPYPVKY